MEEETAKRVEEAIRKKVEERLGSEEIRLEIQRQLEEGRKKVASDVVAQLEKEKEAAVIEARRKEVSYPTSSLMYIKGLFVLKKTLLKPLKSEN